MKHPQKQQKKGTIALARELYRQKIKSQTKAKISSQRLDALSRLLLLADESRQWICVAAAIDRNNLVLATNKVLKVKKMLKGNLDVFLRPYVAILKQKQQLEERKAQARQKVLLGCLIKMNHPDNIDALKILFTFLHGVNNLADSSRLSFSVIEQSELSHSHKVICKNILAKYLKNGNSITLKVLIQNTFQYQGVKLDVSIQEVMQAFKDYDACNRYQMYETNNSKMVSDKLSQVKQKMRNIYNKLKEAALKDGMTKADIDKLVRDIYQASSNKIFKKKYSEAHARRDIKKILLSIKGYRIHSAKVIKARKQQTLHGVNKLLLCNQSAFRHAEQDVARYMIMDAWVMSYLQGHRQRSEFVDKVLCQYQSSQSALDNWALADEHTKSLCFNRLLNGNKAFRTTIAHFAKSLSIGVGVAMKCCPGCSQELDAVGVVYSDSHQYACPTEKLFTKEAYPFIPPPKGEVHDLSSDIATTDVSKAAMLSSLDSDSDKDSQVSKKARPQASVRFFKSRQQIQLEQAIREIGLRPLCDIKKNR